MQTKPTENRKIAGGSVPETTGKVCSEASPFAGFHGGSFVTTGEEDFGHISFIDISRFRINYINI